MNSTRTLSAVVGMIVLLSLTGCVGTEPTPSPDPSSVDDQTAPPVDSTLAPEPEAVIVVAGVDVDGLNVTVSSYVAGILEEGGECHYSFVGTSAETSVVATGHADRSVTTCGSTQVPIGQFTKGTWEATMRYTALSGVETVSSPVKVEIP